MHKEPFVGLASPRPAWELTRPPDSLTRFGEETPETGKGHKGEEGERKGEDEGGDRKREERGKCLATFYTHDTCTSFFHFQLCLQCVVRVCC